MAARHARYVRNKKEFGEFMRSEQMREVTNEVAQDIAAMAAANTPRSKRKRNKRSPHLADNFKVKRNAGLIKVSRSRRVLVEVYNPSRHAGAVEFGHRGKRGRRMLGKAGAAHGDFKPKGGPDA